MTYMWLIMRLALCIFAGVEGYLNGSGWSSTRPVTPLLLLGMVFYGVIVIPLVTGVQRLNPRNQPVWHFPSWMRNPLTLRDPLQFFLMVGALFTAAGVGMITQRMQLQLPVALTQLVLPAFGVGIVGGTYLSAYVYRRKLSPD